jgi:glutathione S-transferase
MDPTQFPAFQTYALFATGLCALTMVLDGVSATFRVKSKTTLNTEDASTVSKGARVVDDERPSVARANRAWRNAFANIVPFLFVAWLYVLTGASARNATIYFGVFAAARVIHSVVYLAGKQPWRTLMFVIGQLCTLGMAVQVVRHALA